MSDVLFLFQVIKKWGEYSYDVQFILQRSPLGGTAQADQKPVSSWAGDNKTGSQPSHGIWKSAPGSRLNPDPAGSRLHPDPARLNPDSARLSPDSGKAEYDNSIVC